MTVIVWTRALHLQINQSVNQSKELKKNVILMRYFLPNWLLISSHLGPLTVTVVGAPLIMLQITFMTE